MVRHHPDGHRRKIFFSILCGCESNIIKAHGVKYQFGSTPGVGCQYGSFTLKTLLHLRQNHNLPSWVGFVDMVRSFHTSNYKLLISILYRYGAPPRFCSAIRRMYKNSLVRLIIGNIDISTPFNIGVKQEDSMAPILFIFLIMEFDETSEKNGQRMDSQKPHSQYRATHLFLLDRLSDANKNYSTQGIYSNYSACYT